MTEKAGESAQIQSVIQEELYDFPYHHVPRLDAEGVPTQVRSLPWGLEYFCYLLHVRDKVLRYKPHSVLDVGCGDGAFLRLLSREVPRCIGVDISERAISFARAFAREAEFHVASPRTLAETFDVVVAIEVLEHIPDQEVSPFLTEVCGCTRIGGQVIITVPSEVIKLNKKHYRHYNEAMLRNALETAEARWNVAEIDHLFEEDLYTWAYRKLMFRRYWTIDIDPLRRMMWRYIWQRRRVARKGKGRHLVARCERKR